VPDPIGIGIIGLGFMGRAHVAAINQAVDSGESCELVAVCDRNPEHRAGRFGATSGNLSLASEGPLFDTARVRPYAEVNDLLADTRVRLAIVATHTESHVEVALAALAAGKHVLVEKPVSLRTDQVHRLELAASEAWGKCGLRCMPGMCMRFWPGWDWLRDLILTKLHGQLRSLTLQRLGTTPGWANHFYADPAQSGGAFGDLHLHDADFICWALGTPRSVFTRGTLMHCTTLYTFNESSPAPAPLHVTAEGAWDLTPGSGFRMRYLAVFDHATAEFDLTRGPRVTLYRDNRAEPVDLAPGAGYLPQLRHLLAATRDPSLPLRATLTDAVTVSKIMDAERRSMSTGLPVDTASI
jgi:predicted dehydrogenase